MFMKDHIKYLNDDIVVSIKYFFGKYSKITQFSYGFKGTKFGIFNHVHKMIFHFALINIDLGVLYPKNFFGNSKFYNNEIILKSSNNSDNFWQSSFIILEDKTLKQSPKIFDYT